jgi:molecular chaperone GrpE (heat shock protein)
MNKHFEDARYYLSRATEHAKEGILEELEPVENRFRELSGREEEPEPSRLEKIQAELQELERRAEGETKNAIADARERIKKYRGESSE